MEIDEKDLPFKVEYAKTGRAGCKGCKTPIGQGTVRIAVMVQSSFFDGKQPNWFHDDCFFKKQRPTSEGDIGNFHQLKTEDKKKLREKIELNSSTLVTSGKAEKGKGKKRSKNDTDAAGPIKDFGIEYSKSSRATCVGCEQKITKGDVRIKKVVFDTEIGIKFGGQPLWHHVECFAQVRNDLAFYASGDVLPGFKSLKKEDQELVKKSIPSIKVEELPETKKPKLEPKDEIDKAAEVALDKKIDSQSQILFKYRNLCSKDMTKNNVLELLTYNKQEPAVKDNDKLFNQAADMLAFGALKQCNVCKGGQLFFSRSGYLCNGNLTEWVKCTNLIKEPPKVRCKIPNNLKEEFPILSKYKGKIEVRAMKYVPPSATTIAKSIKKQEELTGPRVKRERPPLYNLTFAIVGLKSSDKLTTTILKLGGKVSKKIDEKIVAIISEQEIVDKMPSQMKKAKEIGIHVLPVDYLDTVKDDPNGAISYISSKSLCDWGIDPTTRIPAEEERSLKSKSIYTKSVPKSMTLKLKGGLAVDPDSNLDDVAHVYNCHGDIYNAVLGLTDIQKNKNSYYKLQILESDKKNKYWLFRSWGRIGTTIGGSKVENCSSLDEARNKFHTLYSEKSGNEFEDREHFEKLPGLMYPIDIDYSADDDVKLNIKHHIDSKLSKPVQDLIQLIFDVDAMKKVMLEFDLDMEKMPLGKLSQKQIQQAYKVLTELSILIQNGSAENHKYIDASNRFYTLIPHNFGIESPPILQTAEQIKHHSELLDNLMEIECAYSMLKVDNNNDDKNPIDQHYEKLQTELLPIDKKSDEYKLLEKYVKNTHAETHSSYGLSILDIFKVSRKGEARRYKPFKKLHNRKLLWHGSRLTNFAGILSHGLKIAPPEAPSTGYMFGKGIYFADMVSKSANYCSTSSQNSTGLMLLSEVAMGDMYELNKSNYITKLPKDKHSVKGVGRTQPNPIESHYREDGVEIPLGSSTTSDIQTSLLYNEFIVYDVAQVNVQYLLKMKFNYNY